MTLPDAIRNRAALRAEVRRRAVAGGDDPTLLAWVRDTFGVRIPSRACCTGHRAPAAAFCDAYFARAPVAVWKASRGFGGKTSLLGLLALTEAITLHADVTVLGGSGQQSARVLEAMARLWRVPGAPHEVLASVPGVRQTRFVWGNTITALTASQVSVRGAHPLRLRLDEIDEMDRRILEAAQGQPMDRGGWRAQTVMSSTHQHPDGTMTHMLARAAAHAWPVYEWCWRESLAPHGWLAPDAVDRKRRELSVQMWATEYELQEPSVEGRAIDPTAVDRVFDPARGAAVATDLERGWEHEGPVAGATYATGADWAQARDYTVIVTLRTDIRPLRLVAAYRTHKQPWPVMIGALDQRLTRFAGPAAHDHTGGGRVVGDYLQRPVLDVDLVGHARRDLFLAYITALERGDLVAPRLEPVYTEHKYCRVDDLFGSGHPPDSVVAGALAYHAWRSGRARGDYGLTI